MKENRYVDILRQVKGLTESGSLADAKNILTTLFDIKPVRLLWYIEYARLLMAEGDWAKAISILKSAATPVCGYEFVDEYYEMLYVLYANSNNTIEAKRCLYSMCALKRFEGRAAEDELEYIQAMDEQCLAHNIQDSDYIQQIQESLYIAGEDALMSLINKSGNCKADINLSCVNNWVIDVCVNSIYLVLADQYTNQYMAQMAMQILAGAGIKAAYIEETDSQAIMCRIDELTKERPEEMFVLLAPGCLLNELAMTEAGKRDVERLETYELDYMEHAFKLGRAGSYVAYLDCLYDADVKHMLCSKPEKKISVVIPARNNADTLKYTIISCINQRKCCVSGAQSDINNNEFYEDYEILISDNSSAGNEEVYLLCKQLSEDLKHANRQVELRYIHTPRELPLHRSFEYAYLNTKGEFVLSLGSDDAILPWALDNIDYALDKKKSAMIIQWGFGGYIWPGTKNGTNNNYADAFTMGEYHRQGIPVITEVDSSQYIDEIIADGDKMYQAPTLYIRSGFRREYLCTLLSKTNRLIGGQNQDICTGIINSAIAANTVRIHNVLAIVGHSGNSIGYKNLCGIRDINMVGKLIEGLDASYLAGNHYQAYIETYVPDIGGEVIYAYSAILYAVSIGVLDEDILGRLDWKDIYRRVISQLDYRDCYYDKKINRLIYSISRLGEEFDYDKVMKSVRIETDEADNKAYVDQINEDGSFIIDAASHNISNIYEACIYATNR